MVKATDPAMDPLPRNGHARAHFLRTFQTSLLPLPSEFFVRLRTQLSNYENLLLTHLNTPTRVCIYMPFTHLLIHVK